MPPRDRGHAQHVAAWAWLAAAALSTLLAARVAAAELAGIRVPESIALSGEQRLLLNGAGIRREAALDRYVVALYLTERRSRREQVLADRGPKRLQLTLLRDQRAMALTDALREAIAENLTVSERESLQAPIDELLALVNRWGAGRRGDTLALDYRPNEGTTVSINGARPLAPVRGADLYPAVLRAWLGADPIDRGLRRALLGE